MKTWLVTGGAGFIGGNFVLTHAGKSARIINLDALTYAGNPDTLSTLENNPEHIFVHGEIGNRALVDAILRDYQPSAILNFAAESHVDRSIDGPAAFVQTNVVGTLNLLESTLAYWRELPPELATEFRFLHVSTDEVYGSLGDTASSRKPRPTRPIRPIRPAKPPRII